jgi:hypothetical protein
MRAIENARGSLTWLAGPWESLKGKKRRSKYEKGEEQKVYVGTIPAF